MYLEVFLLQGEVASLFGSMKEMGLTMGHCPLGICSVCHTKMNVTWIMVQ